MEAHSRLKVFLLLAALLIFTGSSLGLYTNWDGEELEYDKGHDITITCDASGCPDDEYVEKQVRLEACGSSVEVPHSGGNEWKATIKIPTDGDWIGDKSLYCAPGFHTYEVYDPELGQSDPRLGIGSFKVSYSHGELSGGLLALTVEGQSIEGDTSPFKDNLHTWQIYSGSAFNGETGEIRVKEVDTPGNNVKEYKEVLTGYVLSGARGDDSSEDRYVNNLNDMFVTHFTSSCSGRWGICEVSKLELGYDMDGDCGGNCPMGRPGGNDDVPDYKLRGEIVAGMEFDPDNGFPNGRIDKSQKVFHLCDTDVDGIHDIEGRTVYSPRTEFDVNYLQCRNNDWIERPICDPSEDWRNGGRGWDCYDKNAETIDVKFFNMKDLPYSKLTSEFIAGFRIPSAELRDLEEHYGMILNEIQAECWLGNNDDRPSSGDKKGKVTVNAMDFRDSGINTIPSNFEDIFVLTKIPYRENAMNSTYSCVWGYRGYYPRGNENVYQAVNDYALKSRDSEREERTYRELQQIYNSNSGSYGASALNWNTWASSDERGHVSDKLNPIEQEHPYCPGPPAGNDVIC